MIVSCGSDESELITLFWIFTLIAPVDSGSNFDLISEIRLSYLLLSTLAFVFVEVVFFLLRFWFLRAIFGSRLIVEQATRTVAESKIADVH